MTIGQGLGHTQLKRPPLSINKLLSLAISVFPPVPGAILHPSDAIWKGGRKELGMRGNRYLEAEKQILPLIDRMVTIRALIG